MNKHKLRMWLDMSICLRTYTTLSQDIISKPGETAKLNMYLYRAQQMQPQAFG